MRYKFKVGDTVRISHLQRAFQREYDERWTYEYFVVASRGKKQGIPYYTLEDVQGEEIKGTFNSAELTKIKVTEATNYRIEKVLRRRKDQVFVQWKGWPQKYSSWIPKKDLALYGMNA